MRITRRDFMKYCAMAAGALGLTTTDLVKLEKALATPPSLGGTRVVWINGAACTGCTVTLANSAFYSSVQDLLVPWAAAAPVVAGAAGMSTSALVGAISGYLTDTGANGPLDLVFMETLSSAVGATALNAAKSVLAGGTNSGPFVLCVEGAIQTASDGNFMRIGNGTTYSDKATESFAQEVLTYASDANCVAVLGIGTCASFGGIPAATGSVTGARGMISTGKITGGYKKVDTQGYWDYLKANFSGGFIKTIAVTYGGSGYVTTPAVTISGTATATANLTGGVVTSITVTAPGSGYTTAPAIAIDAAPGGGTNATATATLGFDFAGGIDTATWTSLMQKTACISGCPPHPDWIVGTIVYILINGEVPLGDKYHRPLDFYGQYQCTNCLWQTNTAGRTNAGAVIENIDSTDTATLTKGGVAYGDSPRLFKSKYDSQYEGCIGILGCKGRKTKADCSFRRWNSDAKNAGGTGWCVQTRAGCHGCTEPRFPDGWGKFFSYK